jgi:primosomal protein N' (replication factor Y)
MGYMTRVRCIVFNAALGALDYRVPKGWTRRRAAWWWCRWGRARSSGWCGDEGELPGDQYPEHKLRAVLEALPVPPLARRCGG